MRKTITENCAAMILLVAFNEKKSLDHSDAKDLLS